MKTWISLLALLVLSGCSFDASRSGPGPADGVVLRPAVVFEGDAPWTLEERMEHYGVPGVSLAIIADGRIERVVTHGLSDRETGAPVTEDTLFQAGSVSKPVAAFGAMTLVQDGRLTLDGPIDDTLTSWQLPQHEFPDQAVTLTRLLSHTAGMTIHGFPGYAVGVPVPTVVQVLDGVAPANTGAVRVDIEPGSRWRYSGGGYTIAQLMMIDATGQTFPELMDERVVGPIGMRRSTYENPLPEERLRYAAAGVLPDGSAVVGKRHTYPEMAAAGLWTTAEDLARFAIEVQDALRGEGRVLSRPMAEAMLEPVDPRFGRGFALSQRGGQDYFGHGGWDEGFCALLLAGRDSGQGVVVMINSNHPEFMDEVANGVAFARGWTGYEPHVAQPVPAAVLDSVPGRYRYNAETSFTIYPEDGRLFMQYLGNDPVELVLTDEGHYLRRTRATPIEFTEEDGEPVFHFVTDDEGGRQSHNRLADDEVLPREHLVAGRYDAALAAYRAVLAADPDDPPFGEGYLNGQGLDLVDRSRFDEGIALLRINTELYPASANTWDSLGYAYAEQGDRENAIRYYELALEVDPAFPSAIAALAELRGTQS